MQSNLYARAQTLLTDFRELMRERGCKPFGSDTLDERTRHLLQQFAAADPFYLGLMQVGLLPEVDCENLLKRFEQMAKRVGMSLDDTNVRVCAYRLLLASLYLNASLLRVRADRLVWATLANDRLVGVIPDEEVAADLRERQGLVRRAIVAWSTDPRAGLRAARETFLAIHTENEFAAFRDLPALVRRAVFYHPTNPREFLRRVERTVQAILAEPEFAELRRQPGLVRYAAVCRPRDPRTFLRQALDTVHDIFADPEFRELRGRVWLARYAAVNAPSNPKALLRGLLARADGLAHDPEFAAFREAPYLAVIAARAPEIEDSRASLRRQRAAELELLADPALTAFRKSPALVRYTVVRYTDDPRGFLLRAQREAERLLADGEWADFRTTPRAVLKAVVHHTANPQGYLRRLRARRGSARVPEDGSAAGGRV